MNKDYFWTVQAIDNNTDGTWASDTFYFNTYQNFAGTQVTSGMPTDWALEMVYPNTFNHVLNAVVGLPEH